MPDLTLEKLLLFFFAVSPGFFTAQVYALWLPGQKREWGSGSWIEVVSYSCVIFFVWSSWILRLATPGFANKHPAEPFFAFLLICIASPVALGSGMFWLRRHAFPKWFGMDHPTRTGWDHFIHHNKTFFVLFRLNDDSLIGGLFAGNSYASSYPIEPEMYLEEIWMVDENGRFQEPIPNSLGTVIRLANCKNVEFFKVEVKQNVEAISHERTAGETRSASKPDQTASKRDGSCQNATNQSAEAAGEVVY